MFNFENNQSFLLTKNIYHYQFNDKNGPTKPIIQSVIQHFQRKRSVSDLSRSGQPWPEKKEKKKKKKQLLNVYVKILQNRRYS